MDILIAIIFLVILYFIIETAVRNGINHSKIGRLIDKEYSQEAEKKKTFLDSDLDE